MHYEKKTKPSLLFHLTPKPAACFLSVKDDLMLKMLHEYVFDMQLFKKSEYGWVEKQYLQ